MLLVLEVIVFCVCCAQETLSTTYWVPELQAQSAAEANAVLQAVQELEWDSDEDLLKF
jgi:hypothetical protein